MEALLLFGAALVAGAILYLLFFRETRTVSVGPLGGQPALEPLAPRDWLSAELAEYNGKDGKPIYIAADGIIFNMSSHPTGPSFYGPGGPYGAMAGRDASIALATMQVDPDQCRKRTVEELSASERDTLADWVMRFSAKYEVAGYLNDGSHPRTMAESNGRKPKDEVTKPVADGEASISGSSADEKKSA